MAAASAAEEHAPADAAAATLAEDAAEANAAAPEAAQAAAAAEAAAGAEAGAGAGAGAAGGQAAFVAGAAGAARAAMPLGHLARVLPSLQSLVLLRPEELVGTGATVQDLGLLLFNHPALTSLTIEGKELHAMGPAQPWRGCLHTLSNLRWLQVHDAASSSLEELMLDVARCSKLEVLALRPLLQQQHQQVTQPSLAAVLQGCPSLRILYLNTDYTSYSKQRISLATAASLAMPVSLLVWLLHQEHQLEEVAVDVAVDRAVVQQQLGPQLQQAAAVLQGLLQQPGAEQQQQAAMEWQQQLTQLVPLQCIADKAAVEGMLTYQLSQAGLVYNELECYDGEEADRLLAPNCVYAEVMLGSCTAQCTLWAP